MLSTIRVSALLISLACLSDAAAADRNRALDALRTAGRLDRQPREQFRYADFAVRAGGLNRCELARAYYLRGRARYGLRDYRAARADLELSVKQNRDAANTYGLLGHTHAKLRDDRGALVNYRAAYMISKDRFWIRFIREAEAKLAAAQPKRTYQLVFEGYAVDRIMKDSVVYPANEYYFLVGVARSGGRSYGRAFPKRGAYPKNVKGSKRSIRKVVWRGPDTDLALRFALFEHDSGGAAVDRATDFGIRALIKGLAASRGGAIPPGQPLAAKPIAPKWITRPLNRTFGTAHDHMGTWSLRGLRPSRAVQAPLRTHRGFRYHVRVTFQHKGAIVHAYYRVVAERS